MWGQLGGFKVKVVLICITIFLGEARASRHIGDIYIFKVVITYDYDSYT